MPKYKDSLVTELTENIKCKSILIRTNTIHNYIIHMMYQLKFINSGLQAPEY